MGTVGDFNETAKLIIEFVARWKNFPEQSKIHSLVLTLQAQNSSALSENLKLQEMIAAKSREINELRNEIIHLQRKDDSGDFSSGVVIS